MGKLLRCLAFVNLNSGTATNNLRGVVRSLSRVFTLRLVDPSPFADYHATGGAAPSLIPKEAVAAGLAGGFRPDVVMAIGGGHHLNGSSRELLPSSSVLVGFAFSDPLGFDATCAIAPFFDLFYTQDPACVPLYKQRGFNVACCPPAVDPVFFYPEPIEPDTDIVFFGKWTPLRARLITELAKYFRVHVLTSDLHSPWGVTPFPPAVTEDELRHEICRSRLALEVATVEGKPEFEGWRRITNRPQFAALCGVPSLIEPFPELALFFEEHAEIEVYSSSEELLEKAHYLLRNAEVRREMGMKARTRVLETATWDLRFTRVASDVSSLCHLSSTRQIPDTAPSNKDRSSVEHP